jgi:hypothetical protein
VPNFQPKYCTLQSAISDLWKAAPLPPYDGGAGIRARLEDKVTDTCAQYQDQSQKGPVAPGGSYPPTTKQVDTCKTDYILVTAFSASDPAYCRYQPADVNSIATMTYTCPNGGVVNMSTLKCEVQDPPYAALPAKLYSCETPNTLKDVACPNGGTKSGQTCLYKPTPATIASAICNSGYTPVGGLCYNDISLAGTVTAPNGSSVLDSIKTYSCSNGSPVGAFCAPADQVVACEYQAASVSSYGVDHYSCPTTNKTGDHFINYAIADNTIKAQACVAFPITKTASLKDRWCDAPYAYNAATDKCEYQMADYNANLLTNCSGNPGYMYNAATGQCYLVPMSYPSF